MRLFERKPDLSDVEDRLRKLEGRMKDVEMQWETWYEKARRLMWRLTKRAQEQEEDAPDGGLGPKGESGYDGQPDPISAKILARRQRGVLPR